MHYSQFVTVASALALAPTAVVARQAAAAFVTVSPLDTCPEGVAQEITKAAPKIVTTAYTCEKVKISHGLDVSYYSFDIEPLTKDTVPCCRVLKVFDNEDCMGFPTLELPIEGPLEDRCIPERYFSGEVKYISFQLDCEEPPAKKEPHGPKQVAEQGAQQAQQAEHAPKQEAQQGSQQGQQAQHAPKQEAQQGSQQAEHAPKQEAQQGSQQAPKAQHAPKQEAHQDSRQAEAAPEAAPEQGSEQAEQAPEAAPERKAANPADSLGLGELTKILGFR